jgi:hypothetical protein
MKHLAAVLGLLASSGAVSQEGRTPAPVIRVASDGWGDAGTADIAKVLESAGEALWTRFPGKTLPPIEVSRSTKGPITLFERGPAGEVRVKLDVEGRHWAQFAFQFGHEMGHVLCGGADVPNPNLWFEETLCEAASLYVLGGMAEAWKTRPPYPNWKEYSASLETYRRERTDKAKLPEGTALPAWFRGKEPSLRKDPRQRDLNLLMAASILPHFEEAPEHWEAIAAVNAVRGDAARPFAGYLQDWSRSAPEKHRGFIRTIAGRFGVSLDP